MGLVSFLRRHVPAVDLALYVREQFRRERALKHTLVRSSAQATTHLERDGVAYDRRNVVALFLRHHRLDEAEALLDAGSRPSLDLPYLIQNVVAREGSFRGPDFCVQSFLCAACGTSWAPGVDLTVNVAVHRTPREHAHSSRPCWSEHTEVRGTCKQGHPVTAWSFDYSTRVN